MKGPTSFVRVQGTPLASFFAQLPATVWMTDASLVVTFAEGSLFRRLRIATDRVTGVHWPTCCSTAAKTIRLSRGT